MKLFIAGVESHALQEVFSRVKPWYVAYDAAHTRNAKQLNHTSFKELLLTCTMSELESEYGPKIERMETFLHTFAERISYVVVPYQIPIEIAEEWFRMYPDKTFFCDVSAGKDIAIKGKKRQINALFDSNPSIRLQRRKVHLSAAFGTDFAFAPLYSADTTSWRRGAEFGSVLRYADVMQVKIVCNGDEEDKQERLYSIRHEFESAGFNSNLIIQSDSREIAAWNMHCLQRLSEDLWVKKLGSEYFLTAEERKRIINDARTHANTKNKKCIDARS
jgi:hypothetical protein